MPSIADAMGTNYFGAQAHIHASGRAAFSAVSVERAFEIPSPFTRVHAADMSTMLSKQGSGSPGDNLDIWA